MPKPSGFLFKLIISGLITAPFYGRAQDANQTASVDYKAKAYKTLNFGDDTDTIDNKLTEILMGPGAKPSDYNSSSITPVRFGNGDPSELVENEAVDPAREPLQTYFGRGKAVQIVSADGSTDHLAIRCLLFLNNNNSTHNSGLAYVAVDYGDVPQNVLEAKFLETYPGSKKVTRQFDSPSDKHPGISMQYEREFLVYSTASVEAKLSLPTKKFHLVFKNLSQLTDEQRQIWAQLAVSEGGGVSVEEYFKNVQSGLLAAQDQIIAANADKVGHLPMDDLTYNGWKGLEPQRQIYGPPELTVKSTALIAYHMGNYNRSIDEALAAKQQADKASTEKAVGF